MSVLVLHDYWRSGAAYRTRIALHLKGLTFRQIPVDLRLGEQRTPEYLALNPQGLVPLLEVGDDRISQSVSILEWLEEVYPAPALLPATPAERHIVRTMSAIIGSDIHPLNNLRMLGAIRDLGASEEQVQAWISRWINEGFTALEAMITQHGGRFAYGDYPTLADCYLVPQAYAADRFAVELTPFPAIRRVVSHARSLPPFEAAHPDRQPGSGV
jgi:maleylpyruvate isomerase